MSIIFTEGFDWTTTAADLNMGKWTNNSGGSNIGNTAGNLRFGSGSGNYISFNNTSNFIYRPFGSNLVNGVIGWSYRVNLGGSYKHNIIVLFDTMSNVQMGLLLNNDLTVSIFRGTHANVLGTSVATIPTNAYAYFELKWKIDNSITSGDVVLYMDGVAILTLASTSDTQATSNAYATHVQFHGPTPTLTGGVNSTIFIDDIYMTDDTTPLGNVRIQTLNPNANGNSSQFVGSDGNSTNNFQLVDETAYNASDYVESSTLNNKDTYGYSDTLAATNSILAVAINMVALRTDTDPRSIAPVIRHSGTDYDGSNITLGSSATHHQQIHETNPGTSSGWTKSDVDGAEFGVKVTV